MNFPKPWKWVLVIITLSLSLKILCLYKNSVPFTYDQGRDLLEIREMWLSKKPRLIGPTTSLHGVFCGPFWYWAIFPFFLISQGHPLSGLGPLWLLSIAIPILFWILLNDKKKSLFFVSAFALSSPFLLAANHALNSHPMVYLSPLIFLLVAKYLLSQKETYLFLAFFLISSGFHFNVVVASFIFLAIITFLIFNKRRLIWRAKKAFLGLLLPFLPQLLFEIRHNFLQTKTLIKLFSGNTGSLTLSDKSGLNRLAERLVTIGEIFRFNQGFDYCFWSLFFLVLVLMTILSIKKRRNPPKEADYLFLISFFSNLVVLICVLIVPFAIWPWYISSIQAGLVFLFVSAVYWQIKNKQIFSKTILFLFIGWLVWGCLKLNLYPLRPIRPIDPSNLKLRLSIVDKIYQDSHGQGMSIFTFAPNVYDYPYQYLIWYQAKKKYGYLPEKYAYLSGQPEYVPAKKIADNLLKKLPSVRTYLIIEPFESQKEWFLRWRLNFDQAETVWQVGRVKIEKIKTL